MLQFQKVTVATEKKLCMFPAYLESNENDAVITACNNIVIIGNYFFKLKKNKNRKKHFRQHLTDGPLLVKEQET